MPSAPSDQHPKQLGEGKDEHPREDVWYPVKDVKIESWGDPGERLLEVKAVKKRLPGGVNDAESEAV